MVRKKIENKKLEEVLLVILKEEGRFLSIRNITKKLNERKGIKVSPQVIKRHLISLLKKKKITRKNG